MTLTTTSHHHRRGKQLLLALLLTLGMASASSQTVQQLGGVYYAYPAHGSTARRLLPSANDGQPAPRAFYISHYGRHGSRWMPDDRRYAYIMAHFKNKGELTSLGRDVRHRLKQVWADARGNGGKLTPLGARQHAGIAERMFTAYPEVFRGNKRVVARSSVVGRCISSMNAFTAKLATLAPDLTSDTSSDSSHMAYIAYDSEDIKFINDNMRTLAPGETVDYSQFKADAVQPVVRAAVSADRFTAALFKHPETVNDPWKLMSEMWTMASDMQDVELQLSFYDLFTDEEMRDLYRVNNERMQWVNGDVAANESRAADCATRLWENIVSQADSAIAYGTCAANLRFGHDTPLMRLLAFLQPIRNEGELGWTWELYELVPMGANLQMVFFTPHGEKPTADNACVLFMLNERPLTLPVKSIHAGCYLWKDVKAHYAERMEQLRHLRQLNQLNTMVGTDRANTTSAGVFGKGSEEHGQTLPAVLAPNGQAFWTPQTRDGEDKCVAPYYHADSLFQGIRCSHWLVGGCTQDYGSFTISANTRRDETTATRAITLASHPHYYKAYLPDELLTLELTGASHSALLRLTADVDTIVTISVKTNSSKMSRERWDEHPEERPSLHTHHSLLAASNPVHRIYQGWGEPAGFAGHLVAMPLSQEGEWQLSDTDATIAELTLRVRAQQPVVIALGSSLTDSLGAAHNMQAELHCNPQTTSAEASQLFEHACAELARLWAARFHTIDVYGDDRATIRQFYGALYRASFLPRELSDVDGRYPRFASAGATGQSATPVYTDFSLWDIYRAQLPLLYITCPRLSANLMQSLVGMYEDGGWMPIFPCWNSYTAAMIGDHASAAIADAYTKGIRHFDVAKAYEGLRQNAFELPADLNDYKQGKGRRALRSYLRYGYIPLEDGVEEAFHQEEQTSRTLEYAFDDYCLSRLALALASECDSTTTDGLGRQASYRRDATTLARRADAWRKVINPATGYAEGRHEDGKFEAAPSSQTALSGEQAKTSPYFVRQLYITEGAPCHYTWYVPHNVDGLVATLTPRLFRTRLDSMFSNRLYWHGNEPCHQVAYLYDYIGAHEEAMKHVREIMMSEYNDTAGGLSGNDDAGQMSAWYVFAAMGFYPVCPASGEYKLASPVFPLIRINQEDGTTFTIEAPDASMDNYLLPNVTLNGEKLGTPTLRHSDILEGATLHFGK